MIEINGKVDSLAFSSFDSDVAHKKEAIFARVDVKPLQVYSDWKGKEQGYGPSGSPISINEKHTISIPMDFYTLRNFKEGTGDMETVHVRYYETKTPVDIGGGQTITNYDAGSGGPSLLFEGDSLKLDLTTSRGRELFRVFMAHPSNAEYPTKGPKKQPLFRLMRPEESAKKANERVQLENQAIVVLYNDKEMPNSAVAKLHKRLLQENPNIGWDDTDSLVSAQDYDSIRRDLSVFAKSSPAEFIALAKTTTIGVLNLIKEATDAKIVELDRNRWSWAEGYGGNIRELCDVGISQEPEDALAYYLVHDKSGKKAHDTINKALAEKKGKNGA